MPKNTGSGFIFAVLFFLMGFGFVWHITWLILFGLIGGLAVVIMRSFNEHTFYYISKEEVATIEARHKPKK